LNGEDYVELERAMTLAHVKPGFIARIMSAIRGTKVAGQQQVASPAAAPAKAPAPQMPSLTEQHAFLDIAKVYNNPEELAKLPYGLGRVAGDGKERLKEMIDGNPMYINVSPLKRWTVLHQACGKGDQEFVRWLLRHDAKTDVVNGNGQTPANVATSQQIRDLLGAPPAAKPAPAPAPPAAPVAPAAKQPMMAVVQRQAGTGSETRLRKLKGFRQGRDSDVYVAHAPIQNGDTVEVLKQEKNVGYDDKTWFHVKLDDGTEGWTISENLDLTQLPAAVGAPPLPQAPPKDPNAPVAVWSWVDGNGVPHEYEQGVIDLLERKWHENLQQSVTVKSARATYTINFDQPMKQTNQVTGKQRPVERKMKLQSELAKAAPQAPVQPQAQMGGARVSQIQGYGTVKHPRADHTMMRGSTSQIDKVWTYRIENFERVWVHTIESADGIEWAKVEKLDSAGKPDLVHTGYIRKQYLRLI
jgi:hypothetical protein